MWQRGSRRSRIFDGVLGEVSLTEKDAKITKTCRDVFVSLIRLRKFIQNSLNFSELRDEALVSVVHH